MTPADDPSPGARPAGTSSPDEAAQSIQQMFSTIAPTYDRANHILSVGLDRSWWNRTARTLRPILQRPEAVVLDLCCGTGDLTLALDKHRPQLNEHRQRTTHPILALDFSHTMLTLAAKKFARPKHRLHRSRRPPSPARRQLRRPRHLRLWLPQPHQLSRGPHRTPPRPPPRRRNRHPRMQPARRPHRLALLLSTSTAFSPSSAASSPASPAPMHTCPIRSSVFPAPRR